MVDGLLTASPENRLVSGIRTSHGTVNLLAVRRRALWADGQIERHHAAMLVPLTSAQIRNAPVLAARYWAAVT